MLLSCIYSLIPLGLMNDGKGWSLRQNRKVAPVSSHEGFPFTFPSAEVCVNHWVLCFWLTCEARSDLYTFCCFASSFLLSNYELENGLHFFSEMGSKHWVEVTEGWELEVWLIDTVRSWRDIIGTSKMKIASAISTWQKSQRKPIRLWVAYDVSLIILCYKPLSLHFLLHIWLPNGLQYHSKSCYACFYFRSKCILFHPPATEPFHKKARTGFKSYKLAKACLLLSYNLFSLSVTLSAYTVSRFGFRHTEHLLPCPPFKRIKGISEPFRLGKYRIPCQPDMRPFLSLTLWTSHELGWPSPSPKNSCTCWIFCTTFTVKLCETVLLVSGYLDNSAGLNACLSVKLKKACQYLATIFMPL